MCGGEAAECVPPAGLAVGGHGADDGLQVLLLLQAGRVGLGRACTHTHTHARLTPPIPPPSEGPYHFP